MPPAASAPDPVEPVAPVLGAGTSAVDVTMLRGQWGTVVAHLRTAGKLVLAANLEVATPAAFDASGLSLVFPPDRAYGVTKVEDRLDDLRAALRDLFGIEPPITCAVRSASGPLEPDEAAPPANDAEAIARIAAELGTLRPEA